MEILLLMAVGACAFAGSLTLLSGGGGDVLHSGGRVAFLASRRLSRIMRRLAGTRVVACVLVTGVGARMVREARSWPHLAALGREEAAAALLAGLALAACVSGVLFLTPLAGLVVGGALCAFVVARDEARQRGKRREVLAEKEARRCSTSASPLTSSIARGPSGTSPASSARRSRTAS